MARPFGGIGQFGTNNDAIIRRIPIIANISLNGIPTIIGIVHIRKEEEEEKEEVDKPTMVEKSMFIMEEEEEEIPDIDVEVEEEVMLTKLYKGAPNAEIDTIEEEEEPMEEEESGRERETAEERWKTMGREEQQKEVKERWMRMEEKEKEREEQWKRVEKKGNEVEKEWQEQRWKQVEKEEEKVPWKRMELEEKRVEKEEEGREKEVGIGIELIKEREETAEVMLDVDKRTAQKHPQIVLEVRAAGEAESLLLRPSLAMPLPEENSSKTVSIVNEVQASTSTVETTVWQRSVVQEQSEPMTGLKQVEDGRGVEAVHVRQRMTDNGGTLEEETPFLELKTSHRVWREEEGAGAGTTRKKMNGAEERRKLAEGEAMLLELLQENNNHKTITGEKQQQQKQKTEPYQEQPMMEQYPHQQKMEHYQQHQKTKQYQEQPQQHGMKQYQQQPMMEQYQQKQKTEQYQEQQKTKQYEQPQKMEQYQEQQQQRKTEQYQQQQEQKMEQYQQPHKLEQNQEQPQQQREEIIRNVVIERRNFNTEQQQKREERNVQIVHVVKLEQKEQHQQNAFRHGTLYAVPKNGPTNDHAETHQFTTSIVNTAHNNHYDQSAADYSPPSPHQNGVASSLIARSPGPHSPFGLELPAEDEDWRLSPKTLSRIKRLKVVMETNGKDSADVIHHHPVFVKDTSRFWYKPTISREEAIAMLKNKPPGTFIVRDSNSFPGAFGLALKVAQPPAGVPSSADGNELVRHFLIEPSPKGVRLKGCSNEPVFGTLAALVYQHSITPLALPCRLILPESDPATTPEHLNSNQTLLERGAACNVTYLCSVDTESLTGPEALRRSTAHCFELLQRRELRAVSVHFKVSSQGITLTDNTRSMFFRRHYPVNKVTFAGIDPESRVFDNNNVSQLPPTYVRQAPIFGFVARKCGASEHSGSVENACHLFAELDPDQPASAVVRFITNVMMPVGRTQLHQIHQNMNSQ